MSTSKAICPIRTIVRFSIVSVALPIMLVAQTPARLGSSWVGEAFAQDVGVIAACSSKGLLRIVGNAAECRSGENFVSLVTADALDAVHARMAQMQQQNQDDLKEARQEVSLAIGEMKKSSDAAISRLEAMLEEADARADVYMQGAHLALVIGALSAGLALGAPPEQSSSFVSTWVPALFQNPSVLAEIQKVVKFLSCSQDTDGDGIPDKFYTCPQ